MFAIHLQSICATSQVTARFDSWNISLLLRKPPGPSRWEHIHAPAEATGHQNRGAVTSIWERADTWEGINPDWFIRILFRKGIPNSMTLAFSEQFKHMILNTQNFCVTLLPAVSKPNTAHWLVVFMAHTMPPEPPSSENPFILALKCYQFLWKLWSNTCWQCPCPWSHISSQVNSPVSPHPSTVYQPRGYLGSWFAYTKGGDKNNRQEGPLSCEPKVSLLPWNADVYTSACKTNISDPKLALPALLLCCSSLFTPACKQTPNTTS